MKGRLLYKEEQSFLYTWSWWLVIMVGIPVVYEMSQGFFKQENTPMNQPSTILVLALVVLIIGGVIWLFTVMKLIIKIDDGTLFYSFYPFVSSEKALRKDDLKSLKVTKYSPIMDYGGWGYRVKWGGKKALTVTGNWGLQLELKNGNKVLLGTKRPKELQNAVDQLKQNWGMESYG